MEEPQVAGELSIFEPSNGAIDFHAEADTEFILGSSLPHSFDLKLGTHSVHTSPAALEAAEQQIRGIYSGGFPSTVALGEAYDTQEKRNPS